MSLLELKEYLMRVRMCSLQGLSAYFQVEAEQLRFMLGHWIRKGQVRVCEKTPGCAKTCGKCMPATVEIYEWTGSLQHA